jgi:hypothetical protein
MDEQKQGRSDESLRHEYSEGIQTIRHYSNLRFALFSIFFAVMGGIGFVAFGKGQFEASAALMARIAGFLVIAVFWMWMERFTELVNHFMRAVRELERPLSYSQWSIRPRPGRFLLQGGVMFRTFFCLFMVIWVITVFAVPLDR